MALLRSFIEFYFEMFWMFYGLIVKGYCQVNFDFTGVILNFKVDV